MNNLEELPPENFLQSSQHHSSHHRSVEPGIQSAELEREKEIVKRSRLRRYLSVIQRGFIEIYSRDLHKWLLIAPAIGVLTGLVVTGVAVIILKELWPPLLHYLLSHHWAIVPVLVAGFALAGIIMQCFTPDPNEHSTEEVIRSYHERQGIIGMHSFLPKLAAAVATVGLGGSAALEGPGIYGGGAIGSWLWKKFRRLSLTPTDRRIMLISGAAAGMAAIFRAPLTGMVFALEMPYKDDLVHEALVPSLIASVVAYGTLITFLGSNPLFGFEGAASFSGKDLLWSAVLGLVCGLITIAFDILYSRARAFAVRCSVPHWTKMAVGGLLTGICGLVFVSIFKGSLIPIGPNYEAVDKILTGRHATLELVLFGVLKLAATLFSLASGGVSAMFVPLFLAGDSFGTAFGQSFVHGTNIDLFAAVGMAAFIAGGYKTPLAAVVFVAEAVGGHAYIIPALVGAAVAYTVSGEASVSGDQRLHEGVRIGDLGFVPVRDVMSRPPATISASSTLQDLAGAIHQQPHHNAFLVYAEDQLIGTVSGRSLGRVEPSLWPQTPVYDVIEQHTITISGDCDVVEALRILKNHTKGHVLTIASSGGNLEGLVSMQDILTSLNTRLDHALDAGDFRREPGPRKA